jgi:hypothetical protein
MPARNPSGEGFPPDLPPTVCERLEAVLECFEDAWRAGGRPAIEDYLTGAGTERRALLAELAHADLHYRLTGGEAARAEDYLGRYAELRDDPRAARALIIAEYRLRRPGEPGLTGDEYRRRFPEHAGELSVRLGATPSAPGDDGGVARAKLPGPPSPATAGPGAAPPGYEILGEVGRGGMGVVYRARQLGLNRLVALKMILAGGHAAPQERARFKAEAEAAARLQHPNIVQVHEVGEHEGLPFFSLEYCPGGSLAQKLQGTPLTPAEAARLTESLARAAGAAHQAHLIHRDLKPANVLVAADGTPKITDFGLAKRLDEAGQTASGAVVGTPSYMAPEQARGRSRDVGPAADVYALGAILYECLTGRPPFRAATTYETVLQVLGQEPVAVRQLQPAVPPDLETIGLKCLRKEPGQRYASAEELADDLRRFQEGRHIAARPVSRAERLVKWVRRNPGLAGMTALVVVALLAGTGFSTAFGIAAGRQAERAERKEADALAKGEELAAANEDLTRARDKLETTLARSLLRPLGPQGGTPPPSDAEWEALWELAASRSGRFGYRFVGEATGNPTTARQLRDRAALALPAAVGLDLERRAEVEALLLARMDDPSLGEEHKQDLALAAAAWEDLSSAGAVRTIRRLAQTANALNRIDPPLDEGFSALAARLGPDDAGEAATCLVQAMNEAKEARVRVGLALGLSALAARLEPQDAATIFARVLENTSEPNALEGRSNCLTALAARLEPHDAAQAATTLRRAVKESKDPRIWFSTAGVLPSLVARMEAPDAARATATLAEAITDTRDHDSLVQLTWTLRELADRLEPRDAAQAVTAVLQAIKDAEDPVMVIRLGVCLPALANRLEGPDAVRAATTLRAIKAPTDPSARGFLERCYWQLVARRDARDAAAGLVRVIKDYPDDRLPDVLAGLAPRLDSRDAAQVAADLLEIIKGTYNISFLYSLDRAVSALAARMEAPDAARTAAALLGIIKDIIKDRRNPEILAKLTPGLSALAARLEPRDAATITGQAAAPILQAMTAGRSLDLPNQAEAVSALVAHLGPEDAGRAATRLAQVLTDMGDPPTMFKVAKVLSELGGRLTAQDAAQAARVVAQGIKAAHPLRGGPALVRGLMGLAPRLEGADAAQAALVLTGVSKSWGLDSLAGPLSVLAARLNAHDAAQVARIVAREISTRNTVPSLALAKLLSALADRMEAPDAARVAATLAQALKESRDPQGACYLALAELALAARLDAAEAAPLRAQAAVTLRGALKKDKDLLALAGPQGLSALAACLEPQDLAQAAAIIARATSEARDAPVVAARAWALSAVVSARPPATIPAQSAAAASLVASAAGRPLPGLAPLGVVADRPPGRLSTQQLVELLKMPPFVGVARRVVLDHLGNRYHQNFGDVWEFERFAREQNLDLDFAGAPHRPAPAASAR